MCYNVSISENESTKESAENNTETEKATPREEMFLETPKAFHLEMPLYLDWDLSSAEIAQKVFACVSYSGKIDAYCIWCQKESVFDTDEWISESPWSPKESFLEAFLKRVHGVHVVRHRCTRNNSHEYRAYYYKNDGILTKIGQYPSSADFQIPQAEKYRKVLGDKNYKEFTKAIGLAAHGVGIGSFVYLRRIFENLIEEAYQKAVAENHDFNEEEYKKMRMDEKIAALENHLPKFLVKNGKIYGILSTGIHSLDEESCLAYFEAVRIGIEQILDEKIEQTEKAAKASKANKIIEDTLKNLNK